MKLFYGELQLGEITTNHSMSIENALELLEINMDDVAKENGWDDWEYEELRIEY